MSIQFNPGDRVRVNSGGPIMTGQSCVSGEVYCVWFDKTKHQSGTFSAATIQLYRPSRPITVTF